MLGVFRCMRRLQANLAYLASLADRKGAVPVGKGPQLLTPPSLNLRIKLRGQTPTPTPASDSSEPNKTDPNADLEDRDKYLKELYRRLQALYPGVDPKKEPAFPPAGPGANQKQGPGSGPGSNQPSPAPQKTPQMATVSAPPQAQAVATQ